MYSQNFSMVIYMIAMLFYFVGIVLALVSFKGKFTFKNFKLKDNTKTCKIIFLIAICMLCVGTILFNQATGVNYGQDTAYFSLSAATSF